MRISCLFVILFLSLPSFAARIEVGDNINRIETSSPSGLALRAKKRLGIGASFLGPTGVAGANLEINFSPRWGILGGVGTSGDFSSFFIEYKRILTGESFIPYGVIGLTRWSGDVDGPISSTNPDFVFEDFMSSEDKRKGEINEVLLYPGVGIQYVQLRGDWQGLSVFAQLNVFFDILDLAAAPQVGFGTMYYF